MLALAAVVLAAPGQAAPTLASLAETPGLAATIVVKAGTAQQLHLNGRLRETLILRSAVLLLFESRAEAADFERAITAARQASHRAKGKRLGPAWRRRHPLASGGSAIALKQPGRAPLR